MPDKTDARAKARFRLGTTIFIIGFCSPVLIPFVTATDLPLKWKATLSGALALGIPELFSIIAIALMGKPGFQPSHLRRKPGRRFWDNRADHRKPGPVGMPGHGSSHGPRG